MPERDLEKEVLEAARRIDAEFPELLQENSRESAGEFTELVVDDLHANDERWGHVGKREGQNQYNGHAVDAVMWRPTTEVFDFIAKAGDGPGLGAVVSIPKGPTDQPWLDPDEIDQEDPQDDPGDDPDDDVDPGPCEDCERLQGALEALKSDLRAILEVVNLRFKKIEEKPPQQYEATVEVDPSASSFWSKHSHGVRVKINPVS